jgi:hypothetical protein
MTAAGVYEAKPSFSIWFSKWNAEIRASEGDQAKSQKWEYELKE